MGLIDDLLVVSLVSDEPLTLKTTGIALLVVVPFALLGEVIVDREHLLPVRKESKKKQKK